MANLQYQLTLTSEGVSSGPYYVVTYSTGSGTYFPVINGSPAYLPNVGSTALVVIASGSYTNLLFKLNNGIGGGCDLCDNDVIFVVTGSTPPPTPTPTASPTPTPTATPTASPTPTPTASPTPTPTASPTPSPTPSFYFYSIREYECANACSVNTPDLVGRSSTPLSTTSGVYYKLLLDPNVYQVQSEITPAPMSFDVDLDGALSDIVCSVACTL
jgi:hypothetical protein